MRPPRCYVAIPLRDRPRLLGWSNGLPGKETEIHRLMMSRLQGSSSAFCQIEPPGRLASTWAGRTLCPNARLRSEGPGTRPPIPPAQCDAEVLTAFHHQHRSDSPCCDARPHLAGLQAGVSAAGEGIPSRTRQSPHHRRSARNARPTRRPGSKGFSGDFSFWPGLRFADFEGLNRPVRAWCDRDRACTWVVLWKGDTRERLSGRVPHEEIVELGGFYQFME